jgi:hypothetical protein
MAIKANSDSAVCFTKISDVKRGSKSHFTKLDDKNNFLLFNVVACSRCEQAMAHETILVKAPIEEIRQKGGKNRVNGAALYTLSCNPSNMDFEVPVCKDCHTKPVPNPEPESILQPAPIVPNANLVPFPTQTLPWAVTKVSDDGLVKIWNTCNPKETVKKFKNRELAEQSIVDFGREHDWTYSTFHKLAKECGRGENLEEPAFITKGELKKMQENNRKDAEQKARIEAGKTRPMPLPKAEETPVVTKATVAPSETKSTKGKSKATQPPTEEVPEAPVTQSDEKNDDEAIVARAFQVIKEDIAKNGEDAQSSSDNVAKALRIPTKQAVRICTRLAQNDMIKMEDDSTGDGPYFYITLTKKGDAAEIEAVKGIKIAGAPGRRLAFEGHTIHRLIGENPRRPGTGGFESWNKITDGMLFEDYITKGGRTQDLKWDLDRGWVELRKSGKVTKAEPVTSNIGGGKKMFLGHTIFKLIPTNPRRDTAVGYTSWEILKDGMTYEEYILAGGRYQDLHWDFERGWVKLVAPGGNEILSDAPAATKQLKSVKDVAIADPLPEDKGKLSSEEEAILDLELSPSVQKQAIVSKKPTKKAPEAPKAPTPTVKAPEAKKAQKVSKK